MIFRKNTRKYDISFKCSKKMVFSERIALGHGISCIIWKDGIFFPPKTWYFFLGRKARSNILHEIRGDKMFRVYTYECYKRGATLLCQKQNQRWSYPAKIHLKVIEFLDWHPRKSASNSLCFHGDLYRRFHILLSSEKKQET